MDRKQLQDDRFLDMDPQPFFLAYHRLGEKLYRLREKVVCAFREIDYKKWTPLITKVFGSADFIGIEEFRHQWIIQVSKKWSTSPSGRQEAPTSGL